MEAAAVTGELGEQYRTPEERRLIGKAARKRVRRRDHDQIPSPDHRADPLELLAEQATTRLAELVPLRYGRMARSPFAFFRGAALPMAADLALVPNSGITVQLCGDAHLSNFGLFASPERKMLFDLNDFDETHPGPFEWDLKRLVASFSVLGNDRAFSRSDTEAAVRRVVWTYQSEMHRYAEAGYLEQWYDHIPVSLAWETLSPELSPDARERTEKMLTKAKTSDSRKAVAKLTEWRNGERVFKSDPPTLVPIEEILGEEAAAAVLADFTGLLGQYLTTLQSDRRRLLERYRLTHIARKVVGVGSVGTRAWVLLLTGRDDNDPLLLQAKEAQRSVLEAYTEPCPFPNSGERVVAGQHLLQAVSDIFLGWQQLVGIDGTTVDYYLRQLRDWKGNVDVDTVAASSLHVYAGLCGWALARAHARSGKALEIAGYLGKSEVFEDALWRFAERYAALTVVDHAALVAAIEDGSITALDE